MKIINLSSGSKANATFVCYEHTKILIDAGLNAKTLKTSLLEIGEKIEDINAVFVTHEHSDHNRVDLVNLKSEGIVIRSNNLKVGNCYYSTSINGVGIEAVEAYNKNHNKSNCVGYVLRFDGISLYVSTFIAS